jgi:hypothetical protein
MKAILYLDAAGNPMFFCPGCQCGHKVWVRTKNEVTGAQWMWNGSMEEPTFEPSILIQNTRKDRPEICHSFVHSGQIQFCPDTTHALSGQMVPLPLW